jgi:hypothetical protein
MSESVPVVSLVPLQEAANRLGVCLSSARSMARGENTLIDAWDRRLAAGFGLPANHRYYVPESWLAEAVEREQSRVHPVSEVSP